jgi:hypothetical protein
VSAGGLVATSRRHGVDFIAVRTIPDKQKLEANGNLIPWTSTLGTNTIDMRSIIRPEIPRDDGIQSDDQSIGRNKSASYSAKQYLTYFSSQVGRCFRSGTPTP